MKEPAAKEEKPVPIEVKIIKEKDPPVEEPDEDQYYDDLKITEQDIKEFTDRLLRPTTITNDDSLYGNTIRRYGGTIRNYVPIRQTPNISSEQ